MTQQTQADGSIEGVARAASEVERAVAEHCGVDIEDIRVRHHSREHPIDCLDSTERMVVEWVDRESETQVRTDGGRPEHQAVDGGFVCDECGAVRKTPLGMARHRAREERR